MTIEHLLDPHSGRHGVGSPRERRHDAVAKILDQPPPAGRDGIGDEMVVVAADILGGIFAHPRTKLSRPHQVREENDGG